MEPITNIRQQLIDVKCSLCNHLLTVPPISITSPAGDEFTCGRCKNLNNSQTLVRNIIFESIAKYLEFPCTYENCEELIPWGQSERHEQTCENKTISCPFQNCTDITSLSTLGAHMFEEHEDSILTFENDHISTIVNIVSDKVVSNVLFLKQENLQFILFIHNDFVTLVSIGSPGKFDSFNIKLTSVEQTEDPMCIFYENQNIIQFNERIHCIRCLDRTCNNLIHPYAAHNNYAYEEENLFGVKIHWNQVSRLYLNRITLTLILTENNSKNLSEEYSESLSTLHFRELRKHLECIVCIHYMKSPIYNCEMGHSICSQCNSNVTHCPSCRAGMTTSRNFSLETLIDSSQFPCKFWSNGCVFMDKIFNLLEHEQICPKHY